MFGFKDMAHLSQRLTILEVQLGDEGSMPLPHIGAVRIRSPLRDFALCVNGRHIAVDAAEAFGGSGSHFMPCTFVMSPH